MADISTRMSVSGISQYKSAMQQAQASVKQLDAALKRNEAQFKVTGDQEQYMADKSRLLEMRMNSQKVYAQQAEAALKTMKDQGVNPLSTAYQDMLKKLTEAQTGMLNTKSEMDDMTKSEKTAKDGADQLTESLNGISKKVSLEQVSDAVSKIADGMKGAAQTAVRLGRTVTRWAMGSTEWADDVLTRATQYGVDAETIQKMDNLSAYIDTDVDTIIKARQRLMKNIGNDKEKTMSVLEALGIEYSGNGEQTFWDAGQAIMSLTDEAEKDAKAIELFGNNWMDLAPLFTAGQEEYNRRMEEMNVLTNEQVQKLGEADDAFKNIQQQVALLKNEFWAGSSQTVIDLLQWLVDNKDGVIVALAGMASAFAAVKVSESVLTFMKLVSGLKGLFGGGAAASAATGGGGFLGKFAGGAVGMAKAGISTGMAPLLGAEGLAFYIGKKLIEANLNDENLNAVYGGNEGEGGVIDTMSEEAAKAALEYWKVYEDTSTEAAFDARNRLQAALESDGFYNDEQGVSLIEQVFDNLLNGSDPDGLGVKLTERFKELGVELPTEPELVDNAAELLQAEADGITVKVGAELEPAGWSLFNQGGGSEHGFANGIWSIPSDGYYALHKDERVVPAREVSFRSYNSNLYVEKMYMNSGVDAQGLADAMAAANRRRNSGYGS